MAPDESLSVRISVCIPVRNDGRWLPSAIESVLAQTYPGWELVISDNASDEDLASIVAAYPDERIRYHRWSDGVGTYENHNRSILLARHAWAQPLGSDDRLHPGCLASIVERIDRLRQDGTEPVAVLTRCRRVDTGGSPAEARYYGSQGMTRVADGLYRGEEWLRIMAAPGAPPWNIGSAAFLVRALADSGGAFRPEIGLSADNELIGRIAAYGAVAYIDEPLLDFTVRSDSDGNRRFLSDRKSGRAGTSMGAALSSALAAHEFHGGVSRSTRAAVRMAVARLHLQRAAQHRILEAGQGRRGALADVVRALRLHPRALASRRGLLTAVGALAAPSGAIRAASSVMSRWRETDAD